MDKYKRISQISGLSATELLALTERIRLAGIEPEEIRSSLNDQTQIQTHLAGGWDLVRGASLLVTGLALIFLLPTLTSLGQVVVLICFSLGGLFIFLGLRNRIPLNRRLRRARSMRLQLEGTDGFLWRFRELLEHRDADGPIDIHNSLVASCRASRDHVDVRSRENLVEYWHWLLCVDVHLTLAELGKHDELLEPYGQSAHD